VEEDDGGRLKVAGVFVVEGDPVVFELRHRAMRHLYGPMGKGAVPERPPYARRGYNRAASTGEETSDAADRVCRAPLPLGP
jgi:hypothetical protein